MISGRRTHANQALNLRVGELVEVRSQEEILATLDERGRLDALPFMPEMLKNCGKQFRVFKSAHKTCDTIEFQGARKLNHTVHLDGIRCDGQFHGGCQAGCLVFWKEAWLKRVDEPKHAKPSAVAHVVSEPGDRAPRSGCSRETLLDATRQPAPGPAESTDTYSCQATELNRASSVLPWWDFRQYVKDLTTGNVRASQIVKAALFWLFTKLLRLGGYRALISTYDTIQRKLGGIPYPFKAGALDKTPAQTLNLQAHEQVQVKTQEEILATVNRRNRNRGLSFDEEMVEFCGGTYRVLRRVERIINERTGKMMELPGDCIILDGVTCQSRFKNKRLFCPRSIYPYWREIWLKRVEPVRNGTPAGQGEIRA